MDLQPSEKELLLEKIARLEEEKADLEIMLEAVTGHSDDMEEELLQKVRKVVAVSEKRFRLITETIPVPILITLEKDGRILFANHYSARLFGVPVSSLLERRAQDFYNPQERFEILDRIRKHGILKNREIEGRKEDGSPFWAELTIQPFHYNDLPCLLSIWYDTTDRRILERQLRQSQKMEAIGTMASGIAHDFNNILTAIFGYTELSLTLLSPDSRIRRNLNQIFKSAVRAKELVTQILSFSRQTDQIVKSFRIAMVVEEVAKLLHRIIPSHIQIHTAIDQPDTVIVGDPTQIHQVLMNLCSNAADAMQQTGGRMDIHLENVPKSEVPRIRIPDLNPGLNYIRLSVRDSGPGINRQMMERIFDPFYTTKPPGKGTGLGLSVVHGIVQKHGGAVSVESTPEQGTVFYVYFPVAGETERQTETDREENSSQNSGHILLVDDEESILEVYGEILTALGYTVRTESVNREALKHFRRNPDRYDLIITDYAMPGMTGTALAEEILRIRQDIPVILYTGYHDPDIREKARQIGIQDFLTKPFTRNELAVLLEKHLKK